MDLSTLATDENAEENGKWFDLSAGARINLRSFTSRASRDVRKNLERPYINILRTGGSIPEKDAEMITMKQIAYGVIVNWEGIKEGNKEVKFSPEVALEMLTKYRKFRDMIAMLVAADDAFDAEVKKEAEGN